MKRIPLVATLLLTLSGCITVQSLPNPTMDIFTFTFSTASEMQAFVEKERQRFDRRQAPYKRICIQWNEAVTVPDFVRVVQDGMTRRGVATQVYQPGTMPRDCVTFIYAATRAWEKDRAYLNYATMALQKEGRTLASVAYEPRVMDRWASTDAKLIFLVDQLLFALQPPAVAP
ncbi:hypothetical protein [Vogesella oryzae]|uniref:hypothetical protein n=1 Tax=Vogesella oryzae TaxID=1735285 RepID=UPI0015838C1A|nr:hypothetical protein [Vogesella oryzae]